MFKELLMTAIHQKQVLVLRYHGYTRTVEPHCYGSDKTADGKLRCWQIEGGSNSGERHGWKLLNVREIHSTSTNGAVFSSARAGYKRGDPAMQHIYAQL